MRRGLLLRRALAVAVLMVGGSAAVAHAAPAVRENAVAVEVLVFHGPVAEQQDPVARAAQAIKELGQADGIAVTETTDPATFAPATLARYRAVVFLSAAGAALSGPQEAALQSYVKAGNGFVGIADAASAQLDSAWFTGLIGTRPAGSVPVPEPVAKVTASGENTPNETKEKLTDG